MPTKTARMEGKTARRQLTNTVKKMADKTARRWLTKQREDGWQNSKKTADKHSKKTADKHSKKIPNKNRDYNNLSSHKKNASSNKSMIVRTRALLLVRTLGVNNIHKEFSNIKTNACGYYSCK